jgi:hypothetical protein
MCVKGNEEKMELSRPPGHFHTAPLRSSAAARSRAGQIVEQGTGAERMALNGHYAKMYTTQASSYRDG